MWAPLKEPVFRALWIAAFVSNIGSLMQDVASAWLMTSITKEPLMVALLQTASNAPFFLLALLAGTLADVIDRRKLLIIGQWWMGIAALLLGILTIMGDTNPGLLLAFTFVLGLGTAVTLPAWNALTPELVKKEKLEQAIALTSVGYNSARGVGSAVGGMVVAVAGPGWVFILNACSFLGVLGVMYWWKRPAENDNKRASEPVLGAMRAGIRFAWNSPGLRAVFVKTGLWTVGASAIWALLPLIARQQLHLDAVGYGLLLSAFGLGTLGGAFVLPALRKKISLEVTARIGIIVWIAATVMMALEINFWLAMCYMLVLGICWVVVNSCFNVGAQLAVPSWVRARALAIYILIFQGGLAVGASLWGVVGNHIGLSKPLLCAAVFLGIGQVIGLKYHLGAVENFDTTPSGHWTDATVVHEPEPEDGPVQVSVEYTIDPTRGAEFTRALSKLGVQRKRDGAYQWHIFYDLAQPERFVENFLIENWGEHVRQHDRGMNADIPAQKAVQAFHIGDNPIVVRHMLSSFTIEEHEDEKAAANKEAEVKASDPVATDVADLENGKVPGHAKVTATEEATNPEAAKDDDTPA